MNIFPAIDLKENKCVRLSKGEDSTSVVFNENPVDQAKYFEDQGCKRLHLVDLDSAFGRKDINIKTIINDGSKWAKEKDGLGVDLVVDAAGVSDTLLIAMDLVRPNGQITKVGWGPKPLGFSLDKIVQKNIRLQGSFSHNWPIWEKVIELLSNGTLDVKPIIGGVWPISDWEKAFKEMHSGKIIKSVLKPV